MPNYDDEIDDRETDTRDHDTGIDASSIRYREPLDKPTMTHRTCDQQYNNINNSTSIPTTRASESDTTSVQSSRSSSNQSNDPVSRWQAYYWHCRIKAIEKLGGRCEKCDETDVRLLEFNHLIGGGVEESRKMNKITFFKQIASGERDDINLLCANHNIAYEYERGTRRLPGIEESRVILNRHSRIRTSKLDLLQIRRDYPKLFEALEAIPPKLAVCALNGICLTRRCYKGLWRNPNYLKYWLRKRERFLEYAKNRESMLPLSPLTSNVLEIISVAREFITYDKLIEALKEYRDPPWISMKTEDLGRIDAYPQISSEEERARKVAEEDEARRKHLEDVAKLTRCGPEKLVPIKVRFKCRVDGTVDTEGYRNDMGEPFAICPKCRKLHLLGRSDVLSSDAGANNR